MGEITKIIQYGVSKSAKSEGLYRLLRITDIQYNKVIWENVPFTDIKEKDAENFILENGDFLFARTGATVGKSYLVEDLVEKSVFASYLIRISLLPNNNINYIKYFFNSEFYWQQISEKSIGIGQPNVNGTSLKELFLPLPPLSEQRRIVEKIEELLALVDDLETNKTDLQSYINQAKSKVLEMAVRGELVPQNPEDEPASVLLERIKKEQKSSKSKGKTTEHNTHYEEELPKNWAKTTLGECFEWGSGGTPTSSVKKYYDGNIPWLVIGDLNDNYINTSDKTITQFGLENSSAKLVPKGTLLLAMYGSIGKLGIAGMSLATNQAIAFALENKEINTKYLFYYLLSVRSNLNLLGKGATQKNISQSVIKDFHFPLPPLAEQHRIVEKIEHIFAVLEELEENIL